MMTSTACFSSDHSAIAVSFVESVLLTVPRFLPLLFICQIGTVAINTLKEHRIHAVAMHAGTTRDGWSYKNKPVITPIRLYM